MIFFLVKLHVHLVAILILISFRSKFSQNNFFVKSYIKVEKLILPPKKRKRLICNIREFSKIVVHRN
jgi:hypothetical protein